MKIKRALTAFIAVAIVAAPLAACSSSNNKSNKAGQSGGTVTIKMTDNAFAPKNISAKVGQTVTFRFVNDGKLVHEAFFGSEKEQEDHAAEMTSPNSGHPMDMGDSGHSMHMGGEGLVTVEPGAEATISRTFNEAGTVIIGCHQPGHWESGMKALVTVS